MSSPGRGRGKGRGGRGKGRGGRGGGGGNNNAGTTLGEPAPTEDAPKFSFDFSNPGESSVVVPGAAAATPGNFKFDFNFDSGTTPPPAAPAGGDDDDEDEDEDEDYVDINQRIGQLGLEELPPAVQRNVSALQKNNNALIELAKEYQKETILLDIKYDALRKELCEKRRQIVSGAHNPEDDECIPPTAEGKTLPPKPEESSGVPSFWLQAILNHNTVGGLLEEHDMDIMTYLSDVKCQHFLGEGDSHHGFTLIFEFNENPFFSNTTLTKTVYHKYSEYADDMDFVKSEGTEIQWKEGKDVTFTLSKQKKKRKGKKPVIVEKRVERDSFFNFFKSTTAPELDDDDESDPTEEEEAQQDACDQEYVTALSIKDDLVINALPWFTGEAISDMPYPMMGDPYGDDDDDLDDAAIEELMQAYGRGRAAGGRGGGRGGGGGGRGGRGGGRGVGGEKPPECNQQ